MRSILRGALAALLCAVLPAPSHAQAVGEADVAAIRSVIARQLTALRSENAAAAFSLASPQMRAEYKTPQAFMRSLRASRAVLFRPSSVMFRALWIVDQEVVQQVNLVDQDGARWAAYYPMERQKDGSWRTNGCRLVGQKPLSI